MLKKLLPTNNLPKKPQKKVTQSPNLLDQNLLTKSDNQQNPFLGNSNKLLPNFKFVIIAIQALTLLILGINYVLYLHIKTIETKSWDLKKTVTFNKTLAADAQNLIYKIDLFKQVAGQTKPMADTVRTVITNIPSEANLIQTSFSGKGASTVVEAPSPLSFALLISNYFKEDTVSSITLRSAEFVKGRNVFKMVIDVTFR